MAPASTALLFHPKKKNGATRPTPSPTKPNRPAVPPRTKPKTTEDDDGDPPPEGPYQEFLVVSSIPAPWKYDIMRFDSRRPIDVTQWEQPVKLNRKDPRRKDDNVAPIVPVAVGYMLGPDGKPVVGADGRQVQVDAEGRPIHTTAGQPRPKMDSKAKGGPASRKFQKKTKQVFLIPEATRQLRREERFPWVMEDALGEETWKGSMEEVAKSETHAILLPSSTARDQFNLIPIHRWYKFQKKPTWRTLTSEEADAHMSQKGRGKGSDRWMMAKGMSAQSQATFKAAAEGREVTGENSLVHEAGTSRATGGRQLRAVNSGVDELFGDDEDDEDAAARRRRQREMGHEGDLDELDFEEGFADDEENMDVDEKEDEEAKELEDRLKKEYKQANKTREGHIDESDEEEPDNLLGKSGNAMRKLIGRLEKNDQYESDDEKNPYATSEEEEEEEVPVVQDGPAIQSQDQQKPQTVPDSKAPGLSTTPQTSQTSRAASPAAPSLGHSILAKRATSPKIGKPKTASGSRATSPLASAGSRATSPAGSRAGSPSVSAVPRPGTNKRKAEDGGTAPATPTGATKKKRTGSTSGEPLPELDAQTIINWLRAGDRTTKDFSARFKAYFNGDDGRRARMMALVKDVATMKDGMLYLRKQYRTPSAAPSPAQS